MTPKKRWNILLADDGRQHGPAGFELLQDIPLSLESYGLILRGCNSVKGSQRLISNTYQSNCSVRMLIDPTKE